MSLLTEASDPILRYVVEVSIGDEVFWVKSIGRSLVYTTDLSLVHPFERFSEANNVSGDVGASMPFATASVRKITIQIIHSPLITLGEEVRDREANLLISTEPPTDPYKGEVGVV